MLSAISSLKSVSRWLHLTPHSTEVKKQFMVHPCQINGRLTLVYEKNLEEVDAQAFYYLCAYARQNGYAIKEDRRNDFIEGIKRVRNKSSANVMSIMVLAACLLSPKAHAGMSGDNQHTVKLDNDKSNDMSQIAYSSSLIDLNLKVTADTPEEDLMRALLGWINDNSSYNYDLVSLPNIVKVSNIEIAQIAFGKELPAAIDPGSLGIKGLYNFNNKTIYILDTLDLAQEQDRAILLHELVHFLQYQHSEDKEVACKNELERLAYRLEARFLDAHHHQAEFDEKHIASVSQCS